MASVRSPRSKLGYVRCAPGFEISGKRSPRRSRDKATVNPLLSMLLLHLPYVCTRFIWKLVARKDTCPIWILLWASAGSRAAAIQSAEPGYLWPRISFQGSPRIKSDSNGTTHSDWFADTFLRVCVCMFLRFALFEETRAFVKNFPLNLFPHWSLLYSKSAYILFQHNIQTRKCMKQISERACERKYVLVTTFRRWDINSYPNSICSDIFVT